VESDSTQVTKSTRVFSLGRVLGGGKSQKKIARVYITMTDTPLKEVWARLLSKKKKIFNFRSKRGTESRRKERKKKKKVQRLVVHRADLDVASKQPRLSVGSFEGGSPANRLGGEGMRAWGGNGTSGGVKIQGGAKSYGKAGKDEESLGGKYKWGK